MSKKLQQISVPLISVFLGILLGAIVMWIFGYDAIWGYEELFYTAFGSVRGIGEIFRAMGPLVLIALGFAVASRAGFFNVGLPGQALAGWVLSGWFALTHPDMPRPLLILVTIIIALVAGGIVGAIPGVLRAYLGTSEVIVTIMMNYIVLYVGNAFIHHFPKEIMQSTDSSIRVSANATYQTPWLAELTGNSRMNIGIFFAIIAVGVIWFMLKKTTLGFEIRAVGLNPNASEYAGISAKRTIILSMIISGALAGLGGAVEGLGTFQNVYVQGSSLAIGFNGMAVSLLAANSPIGILFAAFLFGVLQVGAPGMNAAQVPSELVSIVTASIIFFVSVHYIIEIRMSITTMLTLMVSSMLIYAAPLIFTSIGGVFSERGGVVNVGLEGIMVMGAFSGVVFNLEFAQDLGALTPWLALLVGGLVGAIFSLIHAVATIHFRADHVVSGTVLNLMAPALAVFLVKVLYNKGQTDNLTQTFGRFDFPVLANIPVIGDIFFKSTSLLGYLAIAFSFLAWFVLFKTRFGLRLRSVGEHPQAADTLGINVYKMRYLGVVISGFLGGIGGAIYAQSISVNFSVTTIVGPGFIALAAMIFGKWNPVGAMLSSLFFGLSQSLAVIGSQLPFLQGVPAVYLQIAPYLLTIVVLAAFFGKAVAPKADGINYIKSK